MCWPTEICRSTCLIYLCVYLPCCSSYFPIPCPTLPCPALPCQTGLSWQATLLTCCQGTLRMCLIWINIMDSFQDWPIALSLFLFLMASVGILLVKLAEIENYVLVISCFYIDSINLSMFLYQRYRYYRLYRSSKQNNSCIIWIIAYFTPTNF